MLDREVASILFKYVKTKNKLNVEDWAKLKAHFGENICLSKDTRTDKDRYYPTVSILTETPTKEVFRRTQTYSLPILSFVIQNGYEPTMPWSKYYEKIEI